MKFQINKRLKNNNFQIIMIKKKKNSFVFVSKTKLILESMQLYQF